LGTSESSTSYTPVTLSENAMASEGDAVVELHRLAGVLAGDTEAGEVLRQGLAAVARLTTSQHATALLLDARGERIDYRVTLDSSNVAPLQLVAGPMMSRGLAGWVVRECRAALVHDIEHDERWLPGPGLGDLRSAIVAPLVFRGHTIGILTLGHAAPSHFDQHDLRLVEIIAAQVALAIAHSPTAEEPQPPARPSIREVVALSAELRGLADAGARLAAEVFFDEVIRTFFQRMADIIRRHAGTVDTIAGDMLLAIFPGDQARAAVDAAIDMQDSTQRLRAHWSDRLGAGVGGLDVGIAGGPAVVGRIGVSRAAGQVVGEVVGRAARLRELARGEILVSDTVAAALSADDLLTILPLPPLRLGSNQPEQIFQVGRSPARQGAHATHLKHSGQIV
jgi:class 3 adenylate cyclase